MARGGFNSNGQPRNHAAESQRNLLNLKPKLQELHLWQANYQENNYDSGSVIYCDIPYGYNSNVTKYKDNFNHIQFFEWVRINSGEHYIYVSEYNAPDDFIELWSKDSKTGIHHGFTEHKKTVEKLFTYKDGLVHKTI